MENNEKINEIDLNKLGNQELVELLATLEGMDDSLKEQEEILKESGNNNESKL